MASNEFTKELLSRLSYEEFMKAYEKREINVSGKQLFEAVGLYIEKSPANIKNHDPRRKLLTAYDSADLSIHELEEFQRKLYSDKAKPYLLNEKTIAEDHVTSEILASLTWSVGFLLSEKNKQIK